MSPLCSKVYKGRGCDETSGKERGEGGGWGLGRVLVEEEEEDEVREAFIEKAMGKTLQNQM